MDTPTMQQIPVRDINGVLLSPTSPERAVELEEKGKGRLQQDSKGRHYLQLRYTPSSTPPSRTDGGHAKWRRKTINLLRRRDGDACFYCLQRMDLEEMTLEHLLPRSLKGSHSVKNLVLAHEQCNDKAGDLSIAEKVRLREHELLKETQHGASHAVDPRATPHYSFQR